MTVYNFTPRSCNRHERRISRQQSAGNVVDIRLAAGTGSPAAFQSLTWRLVLDQHRRGVLNPAVLEYLMAGVGLRP